MGSKSQCLNYRIDEHNLIYYVSTDWERFAEQNKLPGYKRSVVLKTNIFDFITGSDCRQLYQMLIDCIREKNRAVSFPFRCDSPDKRRFMKMLMLPQPDGAVAFESCIVREESRIPIKLIDTEVTRTEESLSICSWCKKAQMPDERWIEIEDTVAQLRLFEQSVQPTLIHTTCPSCFEAVCKEIEA